LTSRNGRSLAGEFARHGYDLVAVADDDAIGMGDNVTHG